MDWACFPVCFQGPSQWVILEFPQRIRVSQLQIQFQGGFSSRRGCLEGTGSPGRGGEGVGGDTPAPQSASLPAGSQRSEALHKIVDFYPEDSNAIQISYPGLWGGGGLCL